ncbi:Heat shock protein beta-1 [Aphelenchoides avenae]|nr:Heat shock protein beta-1 [Aphelenchus avenae]KAH7714848.1 Heat shock protein beta-1 [Aphelenchus avenae]
MSTNVPFAHHHNWVSPFDSSNLAQFYSPPMRQQAHYKCGLGDVYTMDNDAGEFRWKCDVSGYLPEELHVELDDNELVLTAEHEECREGEMVYRQMKRRVRIPDNIPRNAIKCHIDHHSHLMVEADREPKKHDFSGPASHVMGAYMWPAYMYVPPFAGRYR